jgi:hypothetical protein
LSEGKFHAKLYGKKLVRFKMEDWSNKVKEIGLAINSIKLTEGVYGNSQDHEAVNYIADVNVVGTDSVDDAVKYSAYIWRQVILLFLNNGSDKYAVEFNDERCDDENTCFQAAPSSENLNEQYDELMLRATGGKLRLNVWSEDITYEDLAKQQTAQGTLNTLKVTALRISAAGLRVVDNFEVGGETTLQGGVYANQSLDVKNDLTVGDKSKLTDKVTCEENVLVKGQLNVKNSFIVEGVATNLGGSDLQGDTIIDNLVIKLGSFISNGKESDSDDLHYTFIGYSNTVTDGVANEQQFGFWTTAVEKFKSTKKSDYILLAQGFH